MSDYTLPACSTVVCGMTGSGKTTFALKYLLNSEAVCRFVFDDQGQVSARLRIPHASTPRELDAALATKWVVFNPHRMFDGQSLVKVNGSSVPNDTTQAFRFFCKWAFNVSRGGSGKKILLVDEVWRFCSPASIPQELAVISQMGRAENIELLSLTQRPNLLNGSLLGSATEAVLFRLQEFQAIDALRKAGINTAGIQNLPPGEFVSWNRDSGGALAGRMF